MLVRLLGVCALLLVTSPVWATTYYVATTGSDTADGSSANPFRSIQKCVTSGSVLPGDICTVADGTYTNTDGTTPQPAGSVAVTKFSGTAALPITLKSTNPLGAQIHIPSLNDRTNRGVLVQHSYYIVDGFGFYGGESVFREAAGVQINASNVIVQNNDFHDIALNTCTILAYGDVGVGGLGGIPGSIIQNNLFRTIGRLRTGENGCAAGLNNNDHGIYLEGTTGVTIQRNSFINNGRGWPIHVYHSGGATTTNLNIYNNTFAHQGPQAPGSRPIGHILLAQILNNVKIKNNISYDGYLGMLRCQTVTSATSVSVDYNLSDSAIKGDPCIAGITVGANNLTSTNPGLVDGPGNDFHLLATSAAINAGIDVGLLFNGTAPDIGRYETVGSGAIGFSAATITDVTMDVTLAMNLNVPLLPSSGITGFTVGCTGSNCGTPVVSNASRLTGSDSIVRLSLTGIGGTGVCIAGQTWTVTYTPGNVTDSVGQALASFTAQAVTNACGTAPPPPPSGPSISYLLNENTGTIAADSEPVTGGDQPGMLTLGPTWEAPGKHGASAVHFVNLGDDYIAVPYGSGINPSTQSVTICMGVKPDVGLESGSRIFFSTPIGTNQRFYLGWQTGTWGMGIQSSSIASNAEFPVVAGYTRICLRADSGADTATLFKNGVKGTSAQSVKAYTSYTLSANMDIGRFSGFTHGGMTIDDFVLYISALTDQQILDDYNAWEPASPPSTCTLGQSAHQFYLLRQNSSQAVVAYRGQSATVNVVAGGAVLLSLQVDATVAGCSIAERLRYNVDGGAFLEVPDVFGPDGTAFYGVAALSDNDILKETVTCCLTGGLTAINGATQATADAVPVTPFTTNSSTVQRRILRFDSTAAGKTFCFKEYSQQAGVLGSYTPSAGACVVVVPMASGGF